MQYKTTAKSRKNIYITVITDKKTTAYTYFSLGGVKGFNGQGDKDTEVPA